LGAEPEKIFVEKNFYKIFWNNLTTLINKLKFKILNSLRIIYFIIDFIFEGELLLNI